MIEYNPTRAKAALQYLVESSYFLHHCRRLYRVAKKPRALPFKGELEPLNELVVIARQNPKALDNLLDVVKFKRATRGSYQSNYMAQKRQRDRKVLELAELLHGRKLTINERKAELRKQQEVWRKEQGQLLQEGELDWATRNETRRQFWVAKEQELDTLLEEARKTLTKTVTRKRVVHIDPIPKTVMGLKLQEALKSSGKLHLKQH